MPDRDGVRQSTGSVRSVLTRSEGRAALGGMLVALVLLTLFAIRLHPSGPPLPSPTSLVSSQAHSTFWIVGARQTLAGIAARTGLPVSRLEVLNPRADAGRLMIGQRLRLRPAG